MASSVRGQVSQKKFLGFVHEERAKLHQDFLCEIVCSVSHLDLFNFDQN